MSESKLYGPNNQPIIEQFVYPIGTASLTLAGKPETFLASAIGFDAQGKQVMNPPVFALATWASASVAFDEQAVRTQQVEARLLAMERVLEKHQPDIHDAYVRELAAVKKEQADAAIKAVLDAGSQRH
jgi:hypothetical protein